MEEDIQNYLTTVMFRGTPYIWTVDEGCLHLDVTVYNVHVTY